MNILHIKNITSLFLIATTLLVFSACEKDYSFRGDSNAITLATDTLSYDTLYTGTLAATGSLLVYNTSGEDLTIDRIYLGKGSESAFKICVNGRNTNELTDIRLQRKDSLYVFLNVFPPKTDESQPYLLEDEIVVIHGTNRWQCVVMAYGQNTIPLTGKISSDMQLSDNMPYMVSGTCIVDSSATLTASPGTRILFSDNARLDVYGALKMVGSRDKHVVVKSCNIDYYYGDIPGQWGPITFMPGSKESIIEYAEIANATYAVVADSTSQLTIRNTIICDASRGAILAYGAKLDVVNTLLYNCGGALIAAYGGETSVTHSTLSNYFRWNARKQASVYLSAATQYPELKQFTLTNSIVVGNAANELDLASGDASNILISNCLINLGKKFVTDGDARFVDLINENDASFIDRETFDFHLDSASVVIDRGDKKYAATSPLDFDGNSRLDDANPDLGAFEYTIIQKK